MSKTKDDSKQLKAWMIKAPGNPYASLSMSDDTSQEVQRELTDEEKHQYLKTLGNPYAQLELFGESESSVGAALGKETSSHRDVRHKKLAKANFKSLCRDIFLQYIPAEEGRKLREHHRAFIARNESRSPEERFLLASELKKYDLSSVGNYRAHFNRERDILTKAKLQEIERKIGLGK